MSEELDTWGALRRNLPNGLPRRLCSIGIIRTIPANDNGQPTKAVRITLKDVGPELLRAEAEVFLQLISDPVRPANDNERSGS